MQTLPDLDKVYTPQEATATARYPIQFSQAETYTLWLRGYAHNATSDSAYASLAGQTITVTGLIPNQWQWFQSRTPFGLSITGTQTLDLSLREDGLRLDRLLLTTDTSYTPSDFGPAESLKQGIQEISNRIERTIGYEYDQLYRLTEADYTTGENYQYAYDPLGNRLQQIINGDPTSYTYDAANRIETINGVGYSHDANGNLLTTETMTNTWDHDHIFITQIPRNNFQF